MSYSKTTWKTGDTITAQLLNHAEDGIAANDAAIAAIPAGLQLYGPYYANAGDTTIASGQIGNVPLSDITDGSGAYYDFDSVPTDTVIIVSGYYASLPVTALYGPFYDPEGASTADGWRYGQLTEYNYSQTSMSIGSSDNLTFYATNQLHAKTS